MDASKVISGIVLIAVCGAWVDIALEGEPRLPVDLANGSYINQCCDMLNLSNGQMTIKNQHISYVIERDKAGPYVLPKMYVGASEAGFVIRPNADAMKLRLDNGPNPHRIELLDVGPPGASYSFERKIGR